MINDCLLHICNLLDLIIYVYIYIYLFFTVVLCILVLETSFIYQLMHNRVALQGCR